LRRLTLDQERYCQVADTGDALLVVSSFEEVHTHMGRVFAGSHWILHGVRTRAGATVLVRENSPHVVVCERDLPDGNWKEILDELRLLPNPPILIVISQVADESLWVEVLDLGGFDLLAKPLAEKEIWRVVDSAKRHWNGKREQAIQDREAA